MRYAARAILVNKRSKKILLVKYIDHVSKSTQAFCDGFWALPGGGVKSGETFVEALKREVYEETGIEKIDVKNCILSRIAYLDITTIKNKDYYERYYIVETDAITITPKNLTTHETKVIKAYKWWTRQEIKETGEVILPQAFPNFIERIFEIDMTPIDITDEQEILKMK